MEEREIRASRRRPRKRHFAAGLLFLVLLLFIVVWTQRVDIATDAIRRELERRGVRATYTVTRIGFRTQRLQNVVIGDPANPDLTARFVEVKLPIISALRPDVQFITARGVRMFGRIVDGKLSLGEVDKLLPPPTDKPFALPDLNVDVADARLALVTPAGGVGVAVEGRGNLANGFIGKVAARANVLELGQCTAFQPAAYVDVRILDRRPNISGPLQAARFGCGEGLNLIQPHFAVRANFPETLGNWRGDGRFRAARVESGINSLAGVQGDLTFDGDPKVTRGRLDMASAAIAMADFRGTRMNLDGRYAFSMDSGELSLVGDGGAQGIVPTDDFAGPIVAALSSVGGTPVEPIGDSLANAVRRASQGFDARATVRLVNGPGGGAVRFETLNAVSRSGARLAAAGGDGVTYYWPLNRMRLDGDFALAGGGFPTARVALTQPRGGAPMRGEARVEPIEVGGSRLVLAPIRFRAGAGGTTQVETAALIDGPLGDGRVEDLLVPISGRFGGGGFAIGERCTSVVFRSLRVAGLSLGPSRLPLCPIGPAILYSSAAGRLRGGAELRSPRVAGRLGDSPVALAADRVRFAVGDAGFTSSNLAVRLGSGDLVNRLDFESLGGRFGSDGARGTFAGGSGKLANVPIVMSDARGDWSFVGARLEMDGSVRVADAVEPERFYPLVSNDFRLTLENNQIEAGGWLTDPETGTRVTQVAIEHGLGSGRGEALMDVPGIRFELDGYQPDQLTRLTTGVVALVDGTLKGQGRIAWGPDGVTSTGTFSTESMDLAAPFGPVTGLTTTIAFTDLLGLVSAPGQMAQVDRIQAGIDVLDGLVRYQLLPDLRVRVESGRWPFMGGELFLEETVLDFSQPSTKRLVFRVVGLDAATFVQQMEFSNLSATGTFDGTVPMEFDQSGGRIVNGNLAARGPGNLSYVGELSDRALGTYGKMTFDALKSLNYSKFTVGLNGALEGEFLANVELDGLARNTPDPSGIAGALIGQLKKIPFEFNIAIRGPFRALIATARSFEDPSNLIQPVLPTFLRDQPTTVSVQSDESENVQ